MTRRLRSIRDVSRWPWYRSAHDTMSSRAWRQLEREVHLLSPHGSRQVLDEEAALEVQRCTDFLRHIDAGQIPEEALPVGLSERDSVLLDRLISWRSQNREATERIRAELEAFESTRPKLKPDGLWDFIRRAHLMRETLTNSLSAPID